MNDKTIYALALACVLVPTVALAQGNSNGPGQGDGSCVGNCPQEGGGISEQITEVDVSQQQQQTNLQATTVKTDVANSATAGAISGSNSDSNSSSFSSGGSSVVGVGVKTGATTSGSSSSASGGAGGHAVATGGAGGAGGSADVGPVTANSGDSAASATTGDSNSGGNTQSSSIAFTDNTTFEAAASRAATVYTAACQNGGSAQGVEGGFGITNQDILCEHLKVAMIMREAYEYEMENWIPVEEDCKVIEIGQQTPEGEVVVETQRVCAISEQAQKYLDAYHESMESAINIVEGTEAVGTLDKFFGYMARPLAIIGALVWLI